MELKKNLAKHRLSVFMSVLWAGGGFLIFSLVITPLLFPPVVDMWHGRRMDLFILYGGLFCALFGVALFMVSARRFPYANRYELVFSLTLTANAVLVVLLALGRQYYSGKVIAAFTVFQLFWLGLEMFYRVHFVAYRFAVFPARITLTPEDFPEYKVSFAYSEPEMNERAFDAVIVEDETTLDRDWTKRLASCRAAKIPVVPLTVFLENSWGRIPLEILNGEPDISTAYSSRYLIVKKIIDKILAAIGIVLTLPLMGVLAVLVRLTSGSPIMYKQRRCGLGDRVFVIYKFRTMEKSRGEAARVTRFGAIMRRYHLDELPQLFNVLKGDLALVGPRPETPELSEIYRRNIPYYGLRTRVEQGVVGWALIHQGNVAGIEDTAVKLSYDIYYLKHASLFLDLYIMLKSVWIVLFGVEKLKTPNCLGVFRSK
ncbi:MAG: sugar transferase [Planctomycetes bacterium]|nr:sugar transferase [Planctomycetota bacterium]MCD7895123.1 sugar transferase [Planctomycetaceae bacterium]